MSELAALCAALRELCAVEADKEQALAQDRYDRGVADHERSYQSGCAKGAEYSAKGIRKLDIGTWLLKQPAIAAESSAVDRLTELLDKKDAELGKLEEEVRLLRWQAEEQVGGWARPVELPKEQTLPVPRLEIACKPERGDDWGDVVWDYRLVYRHMLGYCIGLPLGQTKSRGACTRGAEELLDSDGTIKLPFRDGAHIHHDMFALALPAYAIVRERMEKLGDGDGEPGGNYEHQQRMGLEHRGPRR